MHYHVRLSQCLVSQSDSTTNAQSVCCIFEKLIIKQYLFFLCEERINQKTLLC